MKTAIDKDLRQTTVYKEVETLYRSFRRPGAGLISDVSDVHAAPDGKSVVFAGSLAATLEGVPPTRICHVDFVTRQTRVLTFGPNTDRLPKFSPDGQLIAFLSDRLHLGDFQLYLLDLVNGGVRATPKVEGWIEYLHWSPDGSRVLLGVARHGADVGGIQGAIASKQGSVEVPSWMPHIETGNESCRWRCACIYDLLANSVRQVTEPDTNVWEVVWCGNGALAAVVSPGPGEGLWYSAHLAFIEIQAGRSREIYIPQYQLGWPAGSPSGTCVAIVEAFCSDRWLVAGELRLVETLSGRVQRVDTGDVDVTYAEWRSDQKLLVAGHRGFETVIGLYDVIARSFIEAWASADLTIGGVYASASGFGISGDCVVVAEGFTRPPEIAVIRQGEYITVKSFDVDTQRPRIVAHIDRLRWQAPDGVEIQGWLLRAASNGCRPVVMNVHGGPVLHFRPRWLGRTSVHILMLVSRGYSVFLPNPRGSSGRGQEFARQVLGEMGGVDTYDYLSGIDYLVAKGIADPTRLGVMGISYGGFVTAWLITQDRRFAAAVTISPITNWVTEHLTSNIPHFVALFVGDSFMNLSGKYYERSPILHIDRVKTPTLNICGALDRCTPPTESVQFHNALVEKGVRSVLVVYPEEGHGVRQLPAAIDYTVRIVNWFDEYLGSAQ